MNKKGATAGLFRSHTSARPAVGLSALLFKTKYFYKKLSTILQAFVFVVFFTINFIQIAIRSIIIG